MAMKAALDRPSDLQLTKHNALVTVASVILVDGAYFCTMPLLPDFLHKLGVQPGAPVAGWTGLLMGISPAIAAAVGPWWGKLGDRTGLWLMSIRCTGVLCLVWMASALVQNVYQLLVLRILFGFLWRLSNHGDGFGDAWVGGQQCRAYYCAHPDDSDRGRRAGAPGRRLPLGSGWH